MQSRGHEKIKGVGSLFLTNSPVIDHGIAWVKHRPNTVRALFMCRVSVERLARWMRCKILPLSAEHTRSIRSIRHDVSRKYSFIHAKPGSLFRSIACCVVNVE